MKRVRDLSAGLLDSGFAALGTFLAGILAVRSLDVRLLALYAVVSAAIIFAMPLARQLVYMPSQVSANLRSEFCIPVLREEIRRALPLHLLTAAAVGAVVVSLAPAHGTQGLLPLGLTGAALAVVSPIQDHVRSCLHLVGRHLQAALCSVVLAVVVAAVVVVAILVGRTGSALAAVPFGALVLANIASAVVGVVLLRSAPRAHGYRPIALVERMRFLLSEISVQGAWLACTYLVLTLVGTAAVASLEAARIVASPVFILSAAVSTFVAPALLRRFNPESPDRAGALREFRVALGLLVGGAAAWLLVLLAAGPVVALVLDRPFDLGLVAVRVAAAVLEGAGVFLAIALLALERTRPVFLTSLLAAGIGLVGTAALAVPLGAVALPLAQAAGSLARLVVGGPIANRAFDERVAAARQADVLA